MSDDERQHLQERVAFLSRELERQTLRYFQLSHAHETVNRRLHRLRTINTRNLRYAIEAFHRDVVVLAKEVGTDVALHAILAKVRQQWPE